MQHSKKEPNKYSSEFLWYRQTYILLLFVSYGYWLIYISENMSIPDDIVNYLFVLQIYNQIKQGRHHLKKLRSKIRRKDKRTTYLVEYLNLINISLDKIVNNFAVKLI